VAPPRETSGQQRIQTSSYIRKTSIYSPRVVVGALFKMELSRRNRLFMIVEIKPCLSPAVQRPSTPLPHRRLNASLHKFLFPLMRQGFSLSKPDAELSWGARKMLTLLPELESHTRRVEAARGSTTDDTKDDAWYDIHTEIRRVETDFGAAIMNFLVADVLLVAAAEAYINFIAAHVLSAADADNFDKLSPIGKWLFLPSIMNLKWKASLSEGCLQQFSLVVSRRNRVIHAKEFKVRSTADINGFLKQLRLDVNSARSGVPAIRDLIREISLSWRGSYGPDWLEVKKARVRPPCFVLGEPNAPMRSARARRKRSNNDA
jgi:hypothetical protein